VQLLELRKDRVDEEIKEMDSLQAELDALNAENEALRKVAFKAGHTKVQAKRLGEEYRLLDDETTKLRTQVDSLTAVNKEIEVPTSCPLCCCREAATTGLSAGQRF
jgi:predicted nuclease with TOPRIM domain